mgnify:CR=1 FL=1
MELKHVDLPVEMQRAMAKQAEAERVRRYFHDFADGSHPVDPSASGAFDFSCPKDAPIRAFSVTAVSAQQVLPGGRLVYAVCSLEPQEGEDIISAFLDRNDGYRIDPPKPGELPDFVTSDERGWVRILPGTLESEGGLDGYPRAAHFPAVPRLGQPTQRPVLGAGELLGAIDRGLHGAWPPAVRTVDDD